MLDAGTPVLFDTENCFPFGSDTFPSSWSGGHFKDFISAVEYIEIVSGFERDGEHLCSRLRPGLMILSFN